MTTKRLFGGFILLLYLFTALISFLQPASAQVTEQVSLTATIEPTASDLEILISGVPSSGSTLSQNQEVTVTISYKSLSSGVFPATIEGNWEQGLIEGTSSNYIDIFEYVVGSATQADNGTNPVVDTANRKVTWTLPSLSTSSTYHTVSFKLKTRSEIPTNNNVYVDVNARGTFSSTTLPEKSISYTVKRGSSAATPTPTSGPNPTAPAGGTTPTTTPAPQTTPFKFDYVRINEIGDTYFDISFQTSKPSTYTLIYGENPNSLTQKITGLTPQSKHLVKLSGLKPKTQYYFRIKATDNTTTIQSDIFTGLTASEKESIKIARDDFTIHWKNFLLLSNSIDSVVLPKNKPITVTAKIGDSEKISRIKAVFKNNQVLGINNINPKANIGETPLIEIIPGVFSGEIQSPAQIGVYKIVFEIQDVNGGFYTKEAPYKFYISDPLRVVDKKTGKPIESANIKINKYQESLKQFTRLSDSFAVVSRTDEKGELDLVLPTGIYMIEVANPGYKTEERKIELGISNINYPRFELETDGSFQSKISYYKDSLTDLSEFVTTTEKNFFSSQRAKDLFVVFAAFFLLILVILDTHIGKKTKLLRKILTLSILDVMIAFIGITSLLFIRYLGVSETAFLITSTLFIFILGYIYIKRSFFRKKP